MPLETATYIASLVVTNPDGSDQKNTADDHIRLIKATLRRSLPLLDGAVSLSHTQLMRLNDVSASVQLQINTLRDGSATAYNALYANSASYAINADNALSLGGAPAANYFRKDIAQTISAQVTLHNSGSEVLRIAGGGNDYISFWNSSLTARRGYIQMVVGGAFIFNNEQGPVNLLGTSLIFNSAHTVWHSNNDGPGSGLDADTIDGFHATSSVNSSTVAARTPEGYIFASYFNQSSSDSENPNVASVFVSAGDGFLRKATPAYLGTLMQTRNISGKSGTNKTISSSLPSGGQDGDIWYRV